MCTRSATKHPLFGQLIDLLENQIPSYENVVKAFYNNQKTVLEISLQERYSILADRVKCVYSKASIPTIEVNSTIIWIRRLMDKVHTLEKYSDAKRTSDTFTEEILLSSYLTFVPANALIRALEIGTYARAHCQIKFH